jgi:hypothetical protein
MRTHCLLFGVTLAGAQMLGAQTKLSGEGTCDAKPEVAHAIPVGDRLNHAFAITQTKCSWTKPIEIEGIQAKGGTAVQFDEMSGDASRFHGYYLDTMASGDTATYSYQGTSRSRAGKPQGAEWTWALTGSSGKLRGVKGQGSCKGTWSKEGVYTFKCSGDYTLPKSAPASGY